MRCTLLIALSLLPPPTALGGGFFHNLTENDVIYTLFIPFLLIFAIPFIYRAMENSLTYTLSGALGLIFTQDTLSVSKVTGWNYNTLVSHKRRWKARQLSYEKQEEIVLVFGFRKVAEFRYKFPFHSVKTTIDKKLKEQDKKS